MCDRVDDFYDGRLAPEEAAEFRKHLGSCAQCATELREIASLEALTQKHAATLRAARRDSAVTPIASHARWRRVVPVVAAVAIGAAAAYALVVRRPAPVTEPTEAPIALLASSARSIESRVAYADADRYRPYAVQRAAGQARAEEVSLQALARLESKNDVEGVAAGLLLAGDRDRAAMVLGRAASTPAIEVDRAVLALQSGKLEEALDHLDAVPAGSPNAPQALWNKALVLRELRLPLGAAESFDRVASFGEPGWADEARTRAKGLRDDSESQDNAWTAAERAGRAMVTSGALPPADLVRAFPTYLRHQLYHALRAAPSADRVRALLTLATTLDSGNAEGPLARHATHLAEGDFTRRASLAATYARLFADRASFDDAAIDRFLANIRGARHDDLLFGVLELTRRPGASAEMARIAAARKDPWLAIAADAARAREQERQGDFTTAEATLRTATVTCASNRFDYLCVQLDLQLAELLTRAHRDNEAWAVVTAALPRSETHARDVLRHLQMTMGDIARLRKSFPVMRAYLRESVLRAPDDCENKRYVAEKLAIERVRALDAKGAREALEAGPRCGRPITPLRVYILSSIARMGERIAEADSLERDIAEARATETAGEVATIDVLDGHYVLQRDPARGKSLVEKGLEEASKLPESDANAGVARAFAYLTLALDAARNGNAVDAVKLLAADAHVTGDVRCALAVAVDYERAFSAAVGADGVGAVHYQNAVATPAIDPETLVPADVRARLAGCPEVQVFAPAPVHGTPGLLPVDVAWSYRIGTKPIHSQARSPRRVVVTDVEPPPSLGLPRLRRWNDPTASDRSTVWLHGASATPSRVLAELTDATEIQIHAHGFVDRGTDQASAIALSPDSAGKYALTAADVRAASLSGRPIVVLGACEAAHVAPYYREPWSLPLAFMHAGARAVLAAPAPIGDADAGPFFDAVLARIRAGASPAQALRDVRVSQLKKAESSWIRDVLVFD